MSHIKLFLLFLISATLTTLSYSGSRSIYWGQNVKEGALADTCATWRFEYINIAFLCCFRNSITPQLNLYDHYDSSTNGCTSLAKDINVPKQRGEDHLVNWGRPFGDAVLDDIDFDIEGGTVSHWDELVRFLKSYKSAKKVYLTAAPQCPFPDVYMNGALSTDLFDYIWVQFYNNYCYYKGDITQLKATWDLWTTNITTTKVFLGLPVAPSGATSGYIPSDVLIAKVLPSIKNTNKYGVMLWSKYYDDLIHYSSSIKSHI
ncbi:hypothetical protein IFM89_016202 [Coptis chinensis]|uniref:GH18 domain-containing protein n=1 Tax=Coptis chinensis TaxID=261450 RepID=A0A835MF98_9MAGN|nr:hypothetical protein IFM89_016202 [Coptis chinensis]